MRERGMIFNAEMVRAVLEGRKTQTRRMLSPRQLKMIDAAASIGECYPLESGHQHENSQSYYRECCPFGAVGDRLWVRETARCEWQRCDFKKPVCETGVIYSADGVSQSFTSQEQHKMFPRRDRTTSGELAWHPSIHMPRWASRITLAITGVRVERLYAITLGDICKEFGCGLYDFRPATYGFQAWEDLWKSIYGEESWQANPWVWVIEFKRVEGE